MTIRSMKMTAGASLFAAVLAIGASLPERQVSAQVRPVPRQGVAFNDVVTQRVKIESADTEGRTVAFTLPNGQLVILPVADSVKNLDAIDDGSMANITYSEVITMLNLPPINGDVALSRDKSGYVGKTPLAFNTAALAGLKAADMVIDTMQLLFSKEQEQILKTGTRMLLAVEPPETMLRMIPTPEAKAKVMPTSPSTAETRSGERVRSMPRAPLP